MYEENYAGLLPPEKYRLCREEQIIKLFMMGSQRTISESQDRCPRVWTLSVTLCVTGQARGEFEGPLLGHQQLSNI